MGYSEFIRELCLENKVIAITRVHKGNQPVTHLAGCIYRALNRAAEGECLLVDAQACSCNGFAHNSGLKDDKPAIPGGFGLFLSKGSDQRWTPPGERFKCDPQTAEAMFDSLPKNVMDGFDAIKIEPYREGIKADVVTTFVNADQLSAVLVLHGYNRGEYDNAIATTVSGCASMFRIPFDQMKKENSKAVITGTDIAQRHFMDENSLAISVTGKDFEYMMSVTDECFFHSPVFKKVRKRLHKEVKTAEVRFSILG